MKRLASLLLILTVSGCGLANGSKSDSVRPASEATAAAHDGKEPQGPSTAPTPPVDPRPDFTRQSPGTLSRDQVRDGLVHLINESQSDSDETLRHLFERPEFHVDRTNAISFQKADLDKDGSDEYVLALPVTDPGAIFRGHGAALFVIYRKGNRFEVDRTDRMSDLAEVTLMQPYLHGVADLAGTGRLQVIWGRPQSTVTGPQPYSVFVTEWKPGSFTFLKGDMVISSTPKDSAKVALDGKDVVLTGGSRRALATGTRMDRYHYVEGSFRLVDRQFVHSDDDLFFHTTNGETAYGLLWDALVAEDVGRLEEAETYYRAALDPAKKAHPGSVWQYNTWPLDLTTTELDAFGNALRTLVRFRLGTLFMTTGRFSEVEEIRKSSNTTFPGLLNAMQMASSRQVGCAAAEDWATANPVFLTAINRGGLPWKPEWLCFHPPIDDSPTW